MTVAYDWAVQFPLTWQPPAEGPNLREIPPVAKAPSALDRMRSALGDSLARKLTSATDLAHSLDLRRRAMFPTAVAPLDSLLGGGLERGKLVELTGKRSSGRFAAVLSTLAATTQCGEAAALIDLGDGFDPQLGEAAGIDLKRLLWVRPQSVKHAVMAAELLITTGFPLVVLDLGLALRGRRAHEAAWVRLARSGEAHGAAVLVSSPYPTSGTAADAVVSASRAHAIWQGSGAMPRILSGVTSELVVEKLRGHAPGRHESLAVTSPDKPRPSRKTRGAGALARPVETLRNSPTKSSDSSPRDSVPNLRSVSGRADEGVRPPQHSALSTQHSSRTQHSSS